MNASSSESPPLCPTGIEGFDTVLNGGLPRNRLYLVQGDPGVGKTTLALQFLLEGIRRGESCLYITLSETREEMELVAREHGWAIDSLHLFELTEKEAELQDGVENTFFHPSEVELNRTTEALLDEVRRVNPARVVIDSLSEMRMLADTPLRYRRQILRLKQFFARRQSTLLLLDDRTGDDNLQLESIAHGVISLSLTTPPYGISRRQLNVQKLRGRKFHEGYHDFVVRRGGLVVFPRLIVASARVQPARTTFSSGNPELDALLGGGLDRGTSTMLMGPPGAGKSTISVKFAYEAAQRGEAVRGFLFDESEEMLLDRARQLGMNFQPFLDSGLVKLQRLDPAEISPGEFAHNIREGVLHEDVRVVIIDSLNGYLNAMPGERHLNLQLHELLAFLSRLGVSTIMVLAQQGVTGVTPHSVDLTYLADTVVLLRYFEVRGSVRQAISVIKKRSSDHERTIREISVDARGICVGPPLARLQGVLSGLPTLDAGTGLHHEEGPAA